MSITIDLTDRRVLVTAGASGIGLETSRLLMQCGARVMACDVDAAALDRAKSELPGLVIQRCDVSDEQAVGMLFDKVDSELGGLDILVNNAGIAGPTGPIEDLSLADWERTFAVNVRGQFLCVRAAIPRLKAGRSPNIVNLSSAAGHLGMPRRSPYSASKWAVVGLTKTLAIELGEFGIRVNAVLPGAVDGPRIRSVIAAKAESTRTALEEVTRRYTDQAALRRMVTTQDIAHMICFAVSDLASSVTGQELVVDGHTQMLS